MKFGDKKLIALHVGVSSFEDCARQALQYNPKEDELIIIVRSVSSNCPAYKELKEIHEHHIPLITIPDKVSDEELEKHIILGIHQYMDNEMNMERARKKIFAPPEENSNDYPNPKPKM